MRLASGAALAALCIGLVGCTAGSNAPPARAEAQADGTAEESDIPLRPLWGDTHLHTQNSFDAFAAGNRLTPEDALRFARGDEVVSSGGTKARLARPLDFLVVTDHSDGIGATARLYNTPEEEISDPTVRRWRNMMHEGGQTAYKMFREIVVAAAKGTLPAALSDPEAQRAVTRRVWDEQIETVERYNQPGRFTALVGFEYSLQPQGNTLHRNVIFRDGAGRAGKVLPLPANDKAGPEALWDYMDNYERKTGGKVLAIPHNTNLSNGLAFMLTDPSGGPMSADYARRRAAHEPLVEMTQFKGDSEAHPFLSPNDEFADFGVAGWENGNAPLTTLKKPEMFAGEYIREALKRGLLIQHKSGVNPYAFGLIGSTDSHTSLSTSDEDNYFGKMASDEQGTPRMSEVVNPNNAATRMGWQYLAGGMAAVWARANTREAIFDAMMRRETYATTGTRITLRVFAGRDFTARDMKGDWVRAGYARGVPMGGTIKAGRGAPRLMISALKDPVGANLDRVQVIKGWVDARGEAHEKIYDVAWSDPARRRLVKGRLTPVGDTVDLATATYSNSIGAPELHAVWRDPDFRPGERAFYYVRVLEIPTPRWVAYDAVRYHQVPPKGARLKDQERAYSSPIWSNPQ